MLRPFQRDPSEIYSRTAEIEGFFNDFYEWGRERLESRRRKIREGEIEG